MLELISVGS